MMDSVICNIIILDQSLLSIGEDESRELNSSFRSFSSFHVHLFGCSHTSTHPLLLLLLLPSSNLSSYPHPNSTLPSSSYFSFLSSPTSLWSLHLLLLLLLLIFLLLLLLLLLILLLPLRLLFPLNS